MEITKQNIFQNSQKPFKSELLNITRLAPHYHDDSMEIVYCLKGEINLVAGRQRVCLNAGDVFSIDCEDIHYLYSEKESSEKENVVLLTHLDFHSSKIPWSVLKNMFFACETQHCQHYKTSAMIKVKDILLTLALSAFGNEHALQDDSAYHNLMDILYRYFNYYTYDDPDDYMNPELFRRFNSMINFCFENYKGKLYSAQVAQHAHISKSYLSQYLRKTPFRNISSMIKDIRCYKAERLLLTTDLPNVDIAFACGFSDPKYFYSAFNEWWCCSPHTHRSNYKKYMRQREDFHHFSPDASVDIIKDCIIRWHLEKTTR